MTNKLKGFTLVEFLAVFSIIAVLSAVSIASFSSYNNTQVFQTSVSEVSALLNLAKSRAISQVKPSGCSIQLLRGYQVVAAGSDYRLEALCGSAPIVVSRKKLGLGVTFAGDSSGSILFSASTGTAAPGSFTINGYNKTTIITVDSVGTISIH